MSEEVVQLYVKTISGFQPANEAAKAFASRVKIGEKVKLAGSRPRNQAFHDKFFAMLRIVLDNQEYYRSMDHLLGACKLAVGHVDMVRTKKGDVALPKSISFAKMNAEDFSAFYDRAVKWVLEDVIPGLAKKDLDRAVEEELLRF